EQEQNPGLSWPYRRLWRFHPQNARARLSAVIGDEDRDASHQQGMVTASQPGPLRLTPKEAAWFDFIMPKTGLSGASMAYFQPSSTSRPA
ncbi:hypothetical protein, partial [Klebsiella michiganensis]|uniref:hypothetical protein n=1 Tax=Klebsiella michiganensis TaxID=1134687 RepID=UPI001C999CF7